MSDFKVCGAASCMISHSAILLSLLIHLEADTGEGHMLEQEAGKGCLLFLVHPLWTTQASRHGAAVAGSSTDSSCLKGVLKSRGHLTGSGDSSSQEQSKDKSKGQRQWKPRLEDVELHQIHP